MACDGDHLLKVQDISSALSFITTVVKKKGKKTRDEKTGFYQLEISTQKRMLNFGN